MDLFAPTYVPRQSGLSQPTMSRCPFFGVSAVAIHFGPMTPLMSPAMVASPTPVVPSPSPPVSVPTSPRAIEHAVAAETRGTYDRRGVKRT